MITEAHKLTSQGFPIVPLKDRVPILKWKPRQRQLATIQEIDYWFSNGNGKAPEANGIAIAINNTEFGIDTDGDRCESIFLSKIVPNFGEDLQDKVHRTMYTKTPRDGYHRTFKISSKDFPDGIKERTIIKFEGHDEIAIKGTDHILNERGPGYEVINDVDCVVTLSKKEAMQLLDALDDYKAITNALDILKPYYREPSRHKIALCLAGYLHKGGVSKHLIYQTIECLASEIGDSEIADRLRAVEDTCSKHRDNKEVSGYWALLETLDNDKRAIARIGAAFNVKVFNDDNNGTGDGNGNGNGRNGNGGNGKGNPKADEDEDDWKDPRRLYHKLTSKFIFKAFRGDKNPEILWYDKPAGVYRFGGEVKIKEELEGLWHAASNSDIVGQRMKNHSSEQEDDDDDYAYPLTERERNEVVRLISWNNLVDRNDFDADPDIINVRNGLLNVRTKELKPHTPDYLSLKQMPIIYDPAAQPKKILRALSEILDRKSISAMVRVFGYVLLTKSSVYQKAVMLVGYGSNGKSVILFLIEHMAGADNCSHVKLQDLGKNRFATAELFGKFVNTFADIPDTEIQDTSDFKTVVAGDTIYGEKKYHDPFPFDNKSKLIYSTNKIPESFDSSYGFYRRWLIIPCRRLFVNDTKDIALIEKLTTEREMSGLLNLALVGLDRLVEEKGFRDKPIEEIRSEFQKDSETVKEFLEEECYKTPNKDRNNEDYTIEKDELIDSYNGFCRRKDPPIAAMPATELENELLKHGIYSHRAMVKHRKKAFFKGVITKVAHERRIAQEQYDSGQTTFV